MMEKSISNVLTLAGQHLRAGRLAEAKAVCHTILESSPTEHEAHRLLGIIAFESGNLEAAAEHLQDVISLHPDAGGYHALSAVLASSGRFEEAQNALRKILEIDPEHAEAYNDLGNVLKEQGRSEEAVEAYQKALAIRPDFAYAHSNLGNVLLDQGRLEEAVASCRRALAIRPNFVEAQNNLGNALLSRGERKEAERAYRKALEINPCHAKAQNNLGNVLYRQGRIQEASECFRRALEIQPDYADAEFGLGNALYEQGHERQEVERHYREAIRLEPDHDGAVLNLGRILSHQGKLDEALQHFEDALRIQPTDPLRLRMATLLPPIYRSQSDLEYWRNRLIEEIEKFEKEGRSLDPKTDLPHNVFYLAYQGRNDREIQQKLARLYVGSHDLNLLGPNRRKRKDDRIRIGYLSCFLREHTVGRLESGVIENLSREKFRVDVLSIGHHEDEISHSLKESADEYFRIPENLEDARQSIKDRDLDLLFYSEIGMDPFTYALACSRLAPVQCVTWGHPVTTGIETIDYFISSELLETQGADDHYTECLVRLPTIMAYYFEPSRPEPFRERSHFGLREDAHLYSCPQSLFKFHPQFDELLGEILRRDPYGFLVLLRGKHDHWNEILMERFSTSIPDVLDRIVMLPRMTRDDFLNLICVSDVMLDPIHFGGGNSNYESLGLGTPVVTLPSEYLRTRVACGLYHQMGVLDCIAGSVEEYVDIAIRLGTRPEYRNEIRAKILRANDVIFENIEAVRQLERFFEEAVQET